MPSFNIPEHVIINLVALTPGFLILGYQLCVEAIYKFQTHYRTEKQRRNAKIRYYVLQALVVPVLLVMVALGLSNATFASALLVWTVGKLGRELINSLFARANNKRCDHKPRRRIDPPHRKAGGRRRDPSRC